MHSLLAPNNFFLVRKKYCGKDFNDFNIPELFIYSLANKIVIAYKYNILYRISYRKIN